MIPINTVIFDMGGVLIDLDQQACIDAFAEAGYARAGEMLDPYLQTGMFLALEEGKLSPEQLYDTIREQSGKPISDETIASALGKFVKGLPVYKLDMLRNLRNIGYRTFMLSNTNSIMLRQIADTWFTQQGLTLDDYFDRLFLSFEMGVVKPHPEIFHRMIDQSGIRPAEALFIDDAPANIETARNLGFHTYLATPAEDFSHIFAQYSLG